MKNFKLYLTATLIFIALLFVATYTLAFGAYALFGLDSSIELLVVFVAFLVAFLGGVSILYKSKKSTLSEGQCNICLIGSCIIILLALVMIIMEMTASIAGFTPQQSIENAIKDWNISKDVSVVKVDQKMVKGRDYVTYHLVEDGSPIWRFSFARYKKLWWEYSESIPLPMP